MRLIYGKDDERLIFRFRNGFFLGSIQIKLNLYTWLPFFPSSVHRFFFSFILLLFYRSVYVFLTIAICIYLCFAEKLLYWNVFSWKSYQTHVVQIVLTWISDHAHFNAPLKSSVIFEFFYHRADSLRKKHSMYFWNIKL